MKPSQIRGQRSAARVTQGELARALGLDIHTIVDIERGRVGLDRRSAAAVLAAIRALASSRGGPR
jgi:DNA-binding XRE family transcriptional regulator